MIIRRELLTILPFIIIMQKNILEYFDSKMQIVKKIIMGVKYSVQSDETVIYKVGEFCRLLTFMTTYQVVHGLLA